MIPTSITGLLLLVAVLAPGYVWVWFSERRFDRPNRSGVLELAEILVVGVTATMGSLLALLGVAEIWSPLPSLTELATAGSAYPESHPWVTLFGIVSVIGFGSLLALGAGRLVFRKRQSTLSHSSLWHRTLGVDFGKTKVRLAVELIDGRTVEGYLAGYDLDPADSRSLALQRPIRVHVIQDGRAVDYPQQVDQVILEASAISTTWVVFQDDEETQKSTG